MTEGKCKGYHLPSSQALKIVEQNNLWRDAFCWLVWHSRIMEQRDLQLIGHNSYEQIRATLLSMIDWDEKLRFRIGVMNYIHQKRISHALSLPKYLPPCARADISRWIKANWLASTICLQIINSVARINQDSGIDAGCPPLSSLTRSLIPLLILLKRVSDERVTTTKAPIFACGFMAI